MSRTDTHPTPDLRDAARDAGHAAGRGTPPWAIVAVREIVVRLTNKTFVVSTLVMLGLIAGGIGVQAFLATRDQTMHVAVTDQAGADLARRIGDAAHAHDEHALVEVRRVRDAAAAEAAVRAGDADTYLARTATGWQVVSHKEPSTSFVQVAQQVVRDTTLDANARRAGTSLAALTAGSAVTTRSLDAAGADRAGVGLALGTVFGMLLLIAAMTFGMQIASSIVEEKTSRVVEIVAAAIPLRQLLAGKVLGNTALAVGQIVLLVTVGLVGISRTSLASFVPTVAASAGWFVVFFLAGFLALACLWALAGALATRTEDLQSTTAPLTTLVMVAYMAGFLAKGTWMTALSYVPVVSTVLMPVRLFTGDAPWWEGLLSLGVTVLFAVVAVLFSERLYRRSLLQTQGRLTLRQAMRLQD